ncbi:2-methoxy-6-polyprenyl-1,4-benzoquinol methylase, mitochondrial [Pararobbsia alpina]|uniref:class I SAM-dependent methyltransferase n=1 Tax=Pararobbsia alpina TaxID=621374 RepID=UPI0039A7024E
MTESSNRSDVWSEWLLNLRHAGDLEQNKIVREATLEVADRVLDAAKLTPASTLLDVGTGDGLVALRAIERMGPDLKVVMTDVSAPLLDHVRRLATERGWIDQCQFIQCRSSDMPGVADTSVDVVTTRAVLAYEEHKPKALAEIFRVLKPGGTLSIAEPVLIDEALATSAMRQALQQHAGVPPADPLLPLVHKWKSAQFPDTLEAIAASPLTNYNERSLVQMVMNANFVDVDMQLSIRTMPSVFTSWDTFVGSSPHPLAPSLTHILATKFTPDERALFERMLRPVVEAGPNVGLERVIYLTARKPA